VGRALGREAEARRLVDDTEAQIAAIRQEHPDFVGATFSFSFHHAPSQIVTLNSSDDFAVRILNGLGLKLSPAVEALGGRSGEQVSFERLDLLDADVLLMAYADDDLRRSLEAEQLYRHVPAVRDGRDVALGMDATTALRNPSVLSIPFGLDELTPKLAGALDR
jgi:iron complex transport system substrate-binding protein